MFPPYLADMPPTPGTTRSFGYCVSLNNLTDYPDYLIVAQINSGGRQDPGLERHPGQIEYYYWVMGSKHCHWGGIHPQLNLFAVPRAQITPGDLTRSNLGTTLASLEVLNPEVVKSKGITGPEHIRKPRELPFWYGGQTVTDIYTITALTKDTFTIQYVRRDAGWTEIQLFALPLLGMVVLLIIKWVRSSNSTTSDNNSDILDNP